MRKPRVTVHHFPVYISNWRDSETRMRLNASERGVFWELIFFCYKEGSLPDDIPLLARICDVPMDVFEQAWPNVSKSFALKAGRWHNRKVDEELPEIERRYEQKRKAGEASAERRRNGRSTDVEQAFNGRSNGRSTGRGTITRELEQALEQEQAQAVSPALGVDALFDAIHDAYPEHRRDKSHLAQSAFVEIMAPLPDEDRVSMLSKILDGIERGRRSADWSRENGQFVPSLKNFLRDRLWTREYREAQREETQAERCMRLIREQEADEAGRGANA